ncbi:proteasome regulatory particle lid subunit SEM1 [Rhodotorula paludigena]|uniref:26S proteasome complex subunit SEM1 n=1 Tax=Rhodotorula paludigena TaxID=86838 RepID=A0AAV5GK20_9BASI|nr:hypothetical protein Rhopal_003204-T1 [Rhodotorula paludigena]
MASAAAPAANAPAGQPSAPQPPSNANPQLLALQEDDEFEEFPAEDWDQKDTYGATLAAKAGGTAATAAGTQGGEGAKALDSLWEDDWDDDDVGDDFSVQLRGELLKQNEQMQS